MHRKGCLTSKASIKPVLPHTPKRKHADAVCWRLSQKFQVECGTSSSAETTPIHLVAISEGTKALVRDFYDEMTSDTWPMVEKMWSSVVSMVQKIKFKPGTLLLP